MSNRSIEYQRNKIREARKVIEPAKTVNGKVTFARKKFNEQQAMKLAKKRANQLIKKGTKPELMLMQHLNYTDLKYEFQAIIMKGCTFFIPDFLFGNLVVEIDGKNHLKDKQISKDLRRTRMLKKWGYDVIRFTNLQTYTHPEDVIRMIRKRMLGN